MKIFKFGSLLSAAIIFCAGLLVPAVAGARSELAQPLVGVCHKGTSITVGLPAAAMHVLVHGDTLNTCDLPPPPPPPPPPS